MMEKLIAEQNVLGSWRNHGNSDRAFFTLSQNAAIHHHAANGVG
jgi:hypothetical protein